MLNCAERGVEAVVEDFTTDILSSEWQQLNGTERADIKADGVIFKTCIYQTACGNICDD